MSNSAVAKRNSVRGFLDESLAVMQEIVNQLRHLDWTDTTGGSLSIRLPHHPQLFAMTPTHSGFEGWALKGLTVLDQEMERQEMSTSSKPAHPSAIVHGHIYQHFAGVRAIIHTHAPHSLCFACQGRSILPYTLQSQILGEVPCLTSDVDELENRHSETINDQEVDFTTGMSGYSYALRHFNDLLSQIDQKFSGRAAELKRHGLAFTVYKHGVFVMARHLPEAHDNLVRVERNAQVQIMSGLFQANQK